jgi:hypothetical protein
MVRTGCVPCGIDIVELLCHWLQAGDRVHWRENGGAAHRVAAGRRAAERRRDGRVHRQVGGLDC